MKFIRNLTALLSAGAMMLGMAGYLPQSVYAKTTDSIKISIDSQEIEKFEGWYSTSTFVNLHETFPIYIHMDSNAPVTDMEFGVELSKLENSSISCTIATEDTNLTYTKTEDDFIWFTWHSEEAKIPEDKLAKLEITVDVSDSYVSYYGTERVYGCDVKYCSENKVDSSAHLFRNKMENIDYVTEGAVLANDGYAYINYRYTHYTTTAMPSAYIYSYPKTLHVGETGQIKADYANDFSSSNESILTVDSSGKVTAIAPGTVEVTAKPYYGAYSYYGNDKCTITVLPRETTAMYTTTTSTTSTTTTTTTTTTRMTTTSRPQTTTTTRQTSTTAERPTTAATTTTTSTTTTTVAPTETELSLTKTEITMHNGEQYQITANQQNLTYKSNQPDVAIVSKKGVVTAIGEGEAVISVFNADYDAVQLHVTVVPAGEAIYEKGDASLDGSIDILDVIIINRAILGKESFTAQQMKLSDFNGNGIPDSSDAMLLLKYIVGLITELT